MMNIENIANFLFFTSGRLMYDGGVLKITIQKCRPQISPDSVLGLLSIFEFAFFEIV